ncbi:Uncharacterized protein BM_BM14121, partial [Brugia malayi]
RCEAVTNNKEESIILPISIQMMDQNDSCATMKLEFCLNQDLVSELESFPPLSSTARNVDFETSKMLKISLLNYDNRNRAEVLCWMLSE